MLYAISGEGADYALLDKIAEVLRKRFLEVPNATKVEVVGKQERRIYVEFSGVKAANLGIEQQTIFDSLAKQNEVADAGVFETGDNRVRMQVTEALKGVDAIAAVPVEGNGKVIRLGDGTDESHRRTQDALDMLWPYTGELFTPLPAGPDRAALRQAWDATAPGGSLHIVDFGDCGGAPAPLRARFMAARDHVGGDASDYRTDIPIRAAMRLQQDLREKLDFSFREPRSTIENLAYRKRIRNEPVKRKVASADHVARTRGCEMNAGVAKEAVAIGSDGQFGRSLAVGIGIVTA